MDALNSAARVAIPAVDPMLSSLLDEVRAFCRANIDSARIDREARIDGDLLAAIAAQGWFGLTTPEDFGGVGLSLASATAVIAELASHDASVGTCVGLHSGLGLHALLHSATPAVRARYLPEIAEGRRIVAFAATEPGAGSDISSVRTTLSREGSALRLRGTKCFVTNGGIAGLCTVLARSPGLGGARAGHTLVLVDPRWAGVRRGAEEKKLGLKGSSTITLDFDDVTIPDDHVLGEPGEGLTLAHRALGWGRTFMAAGCLGAARWAVSAVSAHVESRVQFGRPLIQFPLVRTAIAELRAEVRAIERTLALVCAHDDLALPSTVVKLLASEGAFRVVDRALQLFGGSGFIEDTGIARRLRDVRVTRIFEGANDVLRLHLACETLSKPIARLEDPELDELGRTLEDLRKKRGLRLFRDQALQFELADAIVGLFAATALAHDSDDVSVFARRIQLDRAREALRRAGAPTDPEREALIARIVEPTR